MSGADQLIADALRDIAAEAGPPRLVADAAWRGRRRRLAVLAASAVSVAGVIALALALALPPGAAPGPAAPPVPPARLVSITLAPATPVKTDVLATAVRLIHQRAAHLHLPDIQARVVGPDVVLTVPAVDRAQLTTLAAAGVLNFRHVLLYQPYGAPVMYGDASLVNQHTLALFRRLACTPGNTGTWKNQVGYATAADYDNPDTQVVACDSSGDKYALDVAKVRGTQITNVTAGPSATSAQSEVRVTLNPAGTSAFFTLTSHLFHTYYRAAQNPNTDDFWLDTIAVVVDGNEVTAPEIDAPIPFGQVYIAGNFTRVQTEELAAELQSGPLPVDFRIAAIRTFGPSASSD